MIIHQLSEFLAFVTQVARKGEKIVGDPEVVAALRNIDKQSGSTCLPYGSATVYSVPHVSEFDDAVYAKVGFGDLVVIVDRVQAQQRRHEFFALVESLPEEIKSVLDDPKELTEFFIQETAFRLVALCAFLALSALESPEQTECIQTHLSPLPA